MSRFRKTAVVSAMMLQLFGGSAALADALTYTPPAAGASTGGTLSGSLPTKAIGSVSLPQGRVIITGKTIEIEAVPDWLFDRDTVLSGTIINTNINANGPVMTLTGLAYFNDGQWLRSLAAPIAKDTIETTGGASIVGNIQAVLADGLEILPIAGGRRKVLFTEIQNVVSPRAYRFTADAKSLKLDATASQMKGESQSITFLPSIIGGRVATAKPKVPKSSLAGTEGGVPNSVIASQILIDVALNVVAPAVAIPIVFSNPNTANKLRLRQAQEVGQ